MAPGRPFLARAALWTAPSGKGSAPVERAKPADGPLLSQAAVTAGDRGPFGGSPQLQSSRSIPGRSPSHPASSTEGRSWLNGGGRSRLSPRKLVWGVRASQLYSDEHPPWPLSLNLPAPTQPIPTGAHGLVVRGHDTAPQRGAVSACFGGGSFHHVKIRLIRLDRMGWSSTYPGLGEHRWLGLTWHRSSAWPGHRRRRCPRHPR